MQKFIALLTASWQDTPAWARSTWLGLALLIAASYALLALHSAYSDSYLVQDDARQHVFWMWRFLDPAAFPHDLIADYFESVAPFGYSLLYRCAAALGITPFDFNKFLPLILGLLTTYFAFILTLRLYPKPLAAFIAAVMLNQSLWLRDDLVSGTPRAFATLLLLGFMVYLARRSWPGCVVMLMLQGLFYPHTVLISLGVAGLMLLRWQHWRPQFSRERKDYQTLGACLLAAALVLFPFALKTADFGPTVTGREARVMPEFQETGRSYFFDDSAKRFWLMGKRSGFLPRTNRHNPLIWVALFLPFLICRKQRTASSPSLREVRAQTALLVRLLLSSAVLFGAAHLLLFQLHLPSRYPQHSMLIVMNVAAAIFLAMVMERLLRASASRAGLNLLWERGLVLLLACVVLLFPVWRLALGKEFPNTNYYTGRQGPLYEFFATQPADSMIASFSLETDFIPSFAGRSVLIAREYAIPYQLGYYRPFAARVRDLLRAQYSPQLLELHAFIRQHGVDFLMLENYYLTPGYISGNAWLWQFQPEAGQVAKQLEQGLQPALATLVKPCTVFTTVSLVVLDGQCLLRQ